MKSPSWFFLLLAYAISWLIWIVTLLLGAGPGHNEYILAFGSAGPALAAIFLSRSGSGTSADRFPARLFSFGVLWLFAAAIYIVHDKLRGIHPPTSFRYYLLVALLAMIPAWILSGAFTRDSGVRELLESLVHPSNWPWQAVAFFFFPVILLIPASFANYFHGAVIRPEPHGTPWLSTAFGGVFFLNNFLFTAALEEPGWRGFLLRRLQQRFSPFLASLFVWFFWALWHAPLDFSGGVGTSWRSYLLVRVIFLFPMTILFTWLYNRSGGNILSVAIFHAAMNTFPFVLPYSPKGLSLLLVFAIIIIYTDRMWRPLTGTSAAPHHSSSSSPSG